MLGTSLKGLEWHGGPAEALSLNKVGVSPHEGASVVCVNVYSMRGSEPA